LNYPFNTPDLDHQLVSREVFFLCFYWTYKRLQGIHIS